VTTLHETLDEVVHAVTPLESLTALGTLKGWVREQEADLVIRARRENVTWADIAVALGRPPEMMDLLYGRRPHEA
jgi:hypothetical protein